MRVLIAVPAYNAARHLPDLLPSIHASAPGLPVLVVDDGSSDHTGAVARELNALVLRHPENRGKGAALQSAYAWALEHRYDAVITLDADGQHPPRYLPLFLAWLQRGADLVIGTRFHNMKGMPLDRWITNRLTTLVISVFSGHRLQDTQSGYRALRTSLLAGLFPFWTERYDTESEILWKVLRRPVRVGYVPIPTVYRDEQSHIRKVRDTFRFLGLCFRFLWHA